MRAVRWLKCTYPIIDHEANALDNPLDIHIKTEESDLQMSIKNRFQQALAKSFALLKNPNSLANYIQTSQCESPINTSKVEIKEELIIDNDCSFLKEEPEEVEPHFEEVKVKKRAKKKTFNWPKLPRRNSREEKALYYCGVCKDNKKLTRSQLREHLVRHGMPEIDSSDFFRKARARKNRGELPQYHRCEICSEQFSNKAELGEHLENHEDQFFCDSCNAGFKKLIDHTIHLQIHNADKLFQCPLCPFSTDKPCFIRSHLYSQHEQFRKYKCEICNKGFAIYSYYEEHKNFHTGEKPFQCDVCGVSFMYLRYLSAHKTQKHTDAAQKGVECPVCKKMCRNKKSYYSHIKRHNSKGYVCDVCGKTFNTVGALGTHRQIHTEERPFKCSFCEKCFKKSRYKIEHERTHTGEKPYKCEYCARGFSQRSSMMRHTHSHTGKRPYTCHLCKKGFVAKSVLVMHLKISCQGAASEDDDDDESD